MHPTHITVFQGAGSWEKVVVCIISDGREKMHPRVFDMLSALGIYQEGVAKNIVDYKPVQAHLYEVILSLYLYCFFCLTTFFFSFFQ
jgi:chitin synthase